MRNDGSLAPLRFHFLESIAKSDAERVGRSSFPSTGRKPSTLIAQD